MDRVGSGMSGLWISSRCKGIPITGDVGRGRREMRESARGVPGSLGPVRLDDLPRLEFADPGPVRDQVVAAIVAGTKTTTTGLALEYERSGTAVPQVGWQFVVLDSADLPAAVIEMTEVRRLRIADIDLRHVLDDGDESVAQWRAAHEEYWHSAETREVLGEPEFTVGDDTMVLAQRFRLVRAL
jgi:uncharacterized protein YhfF